jgi:hypothetical protein
MHPSIPNVPPLLTNALFERARQSDRPAIKEGFSSVPSRTTSAWSSNPLPGPTYDPGDKTADVPKLA